MSGNNENEYDNQNEDNQNYDEDEDQEYDSQDDNNGDNNEDDGDNNDDGDNDDNNDDDENEDEEENPDGPKYIRLRGLPWSATHKEILDFLKGINVVGGAEGIHIATRRWDGVNSGEAYVELKGPQDVEAAMKLDNATMGHRYIEVFNASAREAKEVLRKTSSYGTSYVVKLRGLPFSVTEQQVVEFFNGLEIKPDREGIVFIMDRRGRTTGQAFVQFENQDDTEQALGRNRQKIGHRYIEIFRSSLAELKRFTSGNGRMAPYDLKARGGNRGGNNNNDFGGNNRNNRWGNNGGFGIGANNTLGFNNLPSFGNSGNFGNNNGRNFGNFGHNNGGGGGMGNFGNNNGGDNFGNFGTTNGGGNFGNNSGGGGNMGNSGGFNRFSGNSGNFGNDFGDFGNFGNNRGNNNNNMGGGGGNNMGGGGGGFNNFSNFGNGGGNNMGGGGGFGNNMGGGPNIGGGGNFGPIGGGRNDDLYLIMLRGLPFSSSENDVYKFFEPLRPVNVRIHYNKQNGRHNGTGEALFENYEDAQLAMKRHRCKMGARYIELFFNGKSKPGKGGGGNNYSTGGGNMMSGGSGNNSIGVGGGMGGGNAFSRRI